MRRRTLLLALAALTTPAGAHSTRAGAIAIGHSWALPATAGDGQLFFPMVNEGEKPDRLIAARTPVCQLVELRRDARYDDPPLPGIDLEPHRPIAMRPGARHLRLVGLNRPLRAGESFEVILDFLAAGEVAIEVLVETAPGQ